MLVLFKGNSYDQNKYFNSCPHLNLNVALEVIKRYWFTSTSEIHKIEVIRKYKKSLRKPPIFLPPPPFNFVAVSEVKDIINLGKTNARSYFIIKNYFIIY